MPWNPCLCLPDCWMTKAAFFTSSCDRPSVTTTSTFGTFFLMPLSQVKTFSLINVRALPAEWGRSAIVSPQRELAIGHGRVIGGWHQEERIADFHHPANPRKRRLSQWCPTVPVLVFPPLYRMFWRAPRARALSLYVFSLNSDLTSSLYCTKETWKEIHLETSVGYPVWS